MHLFDSNGYIKKYESTKNIIEEFVEVRMDLYKKRKSSILKKLKRTISILENKIRFINEVVEEDIIVFKKKKQDIIKDLKERKYNTVDKSFDYLLDMKIHFLTSDQIEKFEKEYQEIIKKIKIIENITEVEMYNDDLEKF